MSTSSAQGSITIKRLRSGDTFFISFNNNGVALFQSVDPVTGAVSPSWEIAENQPIITPVVTSSRSYAVTLAGHQWTYNGVVLVFDGTATDNWVTDTTGKFKMNTSTGALRIIKNLASIDNPASDTLSYFCVPTVAGVSYTEGLTKDVDIQIQSAGASSYTGQILPSKTQLSETVTESIIVSQLFLGGTEVSDYTVKWWKDDEEWTSKTGKTISVSRGDVDGTQLIIAEFFISGTTEAVDRAACRIIDTSDDYTVNHRIVNQDGSTTNANREVAPNKPVYVQSFVVNARTNTEVSVSGKWKSVIMDKDTWEPIKTVEPTETAATCMVEVTTAETDRDGQEKDVEVVSEVEW
jgi:hypothetical protein